MLIQGELNMLPKLNMLLNMLSESISPMEPLRTADRFHSSADVSFICHTKDYSQGTLKRSVGKACGWAKGLWKQLLWARYTKKGENRKGEISNK